MRGAIPLDRSIKQHACNDFLQIFCQIACQNTSNDNTGTYLNIPGLNLMHPFRLLNVTGHRPF